jgi:hypothetical protein
MAQNVFQFFIEPSLQELFRDKDDGTPLAGGEIFFFRDKARTEPKPVYQLTGAPDDPVYVELPNPLPLTGIGSTSDGFGSDIKIYYNPFDENGDEDLYFIEVFNSQGVSQFTRESWPQQIDTSTADSLTFVENFYQNSQFLHHFDLPDNGVIPLAQDTTNLAYGGWVFLLPSGFTSQNTVLFERFPDYVENPTVSPRYFIRTSTINPNPAELFKDLVWVNNNVNFLAERTVTLQIEGITNNGFPTNIDIFYEKVYGDGGSPTDTVFVDTFTIQPTDWDKYTTSFTISDNLGKTIGQNDDDEIRFIVRFPSDAAFDMSLVNFVLAEGQFEVLDHPDVSDYQSKLNSLASSIEGPAFDNSNEGDVLTLGGITSTEVGSTGTPLSALIWQPAVPVGAVLPFFSENVPIGFLSCNGDSFDLVGDNSTDNFIRLFDVIGTSSGFGEDTFISLKTLVSQFSLTASRVGAAIAPNAHSSGFTVNVTVVGDGTTAQEVTVDTIAANLIPAGSFFEVFAPSGRPSVYWFEIDGAGTAPIAPTSLVQKIVLTSTDTSDDVADILVANAVTQVQSPDLRGMFIRGWDNGRDLDPDAADRLDPTFTDIVGDVIGSVQEDALQDHQHSPDASSGANGYIVDGATNNIGLNSGSGRGDTGSTGLVRDNLPVSNPGRPADDTRPVNTYLQFIIKT